MAYHMVYLGEHTVFTRREYVFCNCWVQCPVNINQFKIVDGVQIFHILLTFLSSWSIND